MKTLTCVYCGTEYPEGTPPHGSQILTNHIEICPKHPLNILLNKLHRKIEEWEEKSKTNNQNTTVIVDEYEEGTKIIYHKLAEEIKELLKNNTTTTEEPRYKTIYILMQDDWGGSFSTPQPTGQSVKSEQEAQQWVAKAEYPGHRDYRIVIQPN